MGPPTSNVVGGAGRGGAGWAWTRTSTQRCHGVWKLSVPPRPAPLRCNCLPARVRPRTEPNLVLGCKVCRSPTCPRSAPLRPARRGGAGLGREQPGVGLRKLSSYISRNEYMLAASCPERARARVTSARKSSSALRAPRSRPPSLTVVLQQQRRILREKLVEVSLSRLTT